MIELFIGKLPNYQQVLSFIISSQLSFLNFTFKRNLSWIFLPHPAHSWGPPIFPQSSLTAIIIARAVTRDRGGRSVVRPGHNYYRPGCHVTLGLVCLWFFMKQLINLPFPQSMHHVPASVVCDQLIPCKQSDNHWVYPNANFRLSDVENCPCELLMLLCARELCRRPKCEEH